MDVLREEDWQFFCNLFVGITSICTGLMHMAVNGQEIWRVAGLISIAISTFFLYKWRKARV